MKRQYFLIISIIILLSGALLFSNAVYYYGKGKVAKILIKKAWSKSKEDKIKVLPWTWADIHPIAKLSIDSIDLSTFVMNNTSGEAFAFGAGHLPNSAQPNTNGNIVISGHRDSYFRKLKNIEHGDIIIVESIESINHYQIYKIIITDKNDIRWIEPESDDILTLITCYPFNYIRNSDQRMVVRAEKIENSSEGNVKDSIENFYSIPKLEINS